MFPSPVSTMNQLYDRQELESMNRNLRGWAHELRVRGATRKASPISRLMVASLPLRLRRRPIQLRVPAAVEAGEAVTGFAPGIRHGGKGDGGIVEGACGLIVEEMDFSHHRD